MIAKPAAMPGICGAKNASPPDRSVNTINGHRRLTRIALGWCSGSELLAFALASSRAIGGFVCARLPSRMPVAVASSHQPTATSASCVSERELAAITVTAASAVAAPALRSTVVLRKSTNRTALQQRLEQLAHATGAVD